MEVINSQALAKIVVNIDNTFEEFKLQDQIYGIRGEFPFFSESFKEWYKNWRDLQAKVDYAIVHDNIEDFEDLKQNLTE